MDKLIIIAAALMAAALPATAAAQSAPSVTVAATRDPVDKSYRKMLAGMDIFERNHALAPQATLRFQLLPRLPSTQLDGITLRVAGDSVSLPVTVAPDHTFTLERNQQAAQEDAALIASRKTSTLTWRAQVRSPNVPEGMRRLGDLRLECMVGVAAGLLSNNAQMFAWLGELFTSPERVCNNADGNYLFFAERPVYAITLRDGERRAPLPFNALYAGGTQTPSTLPFCDCQVLLDRSYYAPIWDRSWSDDTLLSFEDMDSPPGPDDTAIAAGYHRTGLMQKRLGPAKVVSFDSGYQMWRYTYPARRSGDPPAEFTILFGPDGAARKARLQEPVTTP
ncbi:hypothetical protein [Duganella sp. P38]|uniref:hypothetical protein n=1 Tax=Duganella sp. P38 TaxID=3423949 RepID=UPI003D79AEEB